MRVGILNGICQYNHDRTDRSGMKGDGGGRVGGKLCGAGGGGFLLFSLPRDIKKLCEKLCRTYRKFRWDPKCTARRFCSWNDEMRENGALRENGTERRCIVWRCGRWNSFSISGVRHLRTSF